ncbi:MULTISPECIES: GGDEF domain-containing protein [unclassified Desulfovibrio]|uniref:GGDEF domain-containing protein n=1 Tax=unclassified Desulfovibrio TaxID=2593640 RepID=UPI002FD97F66
MAENGDRLFVARDGKSQVEDVINYVHAVLSRKAIESDEIPENIRHAGGMQQLCELLWGIRRMTEALGKGELTYNCNERGYVIGSLKALQANLRHLTWQARCIAKGEYRHRANFLGDFSTAFNTMVEELDKSVSKLTRLSTRYKEMSCRDSLTGLLNRRAFLSQALDVLKDEAYQGQAVIIMTDIDYFKKINDTWGHTCGDAVLRHMAQLFLSQLREDDLCCRYGGEEFILLLPGMGLQPGYGVAERLRRQICDGHVTYEGHDIAITASLGVSCIDLSRLPSDCRTVFEITVKEADACLYQAKKTGRNRVVCANTLQA